MDGYFETDDVVKSYDSAIFSRIMSYLKPYWALAALTVVSLAFSSAGELLAPVLQQRLIDNAILSRFISVNIGAQRAEFSLEARAFLDAAAQEKDGFAVGAYRFLPQRAHLQLSGKAEAELKNAGVLLSEQWYAFPLAPKADGAAPVRTVISAHPELFLVGEDSAAIRSRDLYALPLAEITAVRSGDLSRIAATCVLLLTILFLVFVFTFIQTWTTSLAAQRVMKDIRLQLFSKTVSQSTAFLSRHPVGRLVTRLTGDVETINEFFTSVLVAFLKDFAIMGGSLVTLLLLSPKLALVVLAILPPVAVASYYSRVKSRDAFRRQRTASSSVNSYLSERIAGREVVQLFRGEAKSSREFAQRNRELLAANIDEMYVFAIFRPIIEFLGTLTTAAVITVGAALILRMEVSLGVLIAFINLISMFFSPVMDIAEKYTLLQSAMAGGERVFKLLDTKEAIPDNGRRAAGVNLRGHIEFDNVTFGYKSGEPVLKNLTFSVQPGEMAAVVGYTGAGKTTIINVLTRLWDIDSGQIRLDGHPIDSLPLRELRRQVVPVLQDVFLFSGTVAENISLGLDLSREEIEAAARTVYAHDFISRLPDGYDTKLSEGAANISAGQRQLLSFARVIAHNPAVIVLDEATSAIDTETERAIQLGLSRVLANRTSIVIAHRLSTIRHADRILVLQSGRLIEEGTHDTLIAAPTFYATLYKLQYTEDEA